MKTEIKTSRETCCCAGRVYAAVVRHVGGGRGGEGARRKEVEGSGCQLKGREGKKRLKGVTSTRYEIWLVSSRCPHPLKKERERKKEKKEITQVGADTEKQGEEEEEETKTRPRSVPRSSPPTPKHAQRDSRTEPGDQSVSPSVARRLQSSSSCSLARARLCGSFTSCLNECHERGKERRDGQTDRQT